MERLIKITNPFRNLLANIEDARHRAYLKMRAEEVRRLALIEDFPHLEDCSRRKGIRDDFIVSPGGWGLNVYSYLVCLDCGQKGDIGKLIGIDQKEDQGRRQ